MIKRLSLVSIRELDPPHVHLKLKRPMENFLETFDQGWKSQKNSAFPVENLPVNHYFCLSPTVTDRSTGENRQNFSLSFGKVPEIFTCPSLFLPVLDRQTVSNFHPCLMSSIFMILKAFILQRVHMSHVILKSA